MKLRWLGCAGYEIVTDRGTIIYVDPWLTSHTFSAPISVGDIQRADAVLLSHAHFDHALDVPEILNRTGAVLLAGQEEINGLNQIERLPKDQLQPVKWDDTVQVKGCKIYVTKGKHIDLKQLALSLGQSGEINRSSKIIRQFHEKVKEILPKGFLVTMENGLRLWHLGCCTMPPIHELSTYADALRPQIAVVQVPANLEESVGFETVKMICHGGIGPSIILPHHHDKIFEDSPAADVDLFVKRVKQAFPELNVLNPKLGQYYQFQLQYS
jgi:L-ascorbate metabolism protein UlaG (beta-lactamase superfamily)